MTDKKIVNDLLVLVFGEGLEEWACKITSCKNLKQKGLHLPKFMFEKNVTKILIIASKKAWKMEMRLMQINQCDGV